MFRPVRMKKLQILVLKKYRDAVIKKLHEEGVVHLADFRGELGDDKWKGLLESHPASSSSRKILSQMMTINRYLDLFEMINPEISHGFITSLFRSNPPKKVAVDFSSEEDVLEKTEKLMESLAQEIDESVLRLEEIEDKEKELAGLLASVKKIKGLNINLEYLGDSEFLMVFLGIFPGNNIQSLKKELSEAAGGTYYLGTPDPNDPDGPVVIICLNQNRDSVLKILRRTKFERIDISGAEGTPAEAMSAVDVKIAELAQEKIQLREKIAGVSNKRRGELKVYYESLEILKERTDIRTNFAMTETTVAIEGWVPIQKIDSILHEVKKVASGLCVAKADELNEPPENTPVLLSNPPFIRSFETLTQLYGLPSYKGIDPTMFLAPGFLLFFGIMLTDAMYGLIVFILGILVVRGGGKHDKMMKDAGIIFASAGASTIVLGALTGGWFGEMGLNIFPGLKHLMILDPMKQAVTFLIIALSLGFIHVNVGVILRTIDKLQTGTVKEVIAGNFWLLIAQPGLLLFYFGFHKIGGILLAIATVLLFMSEKGMAMFALTGYMGDVLSYARLMALGLCTAGIAMTVNVLVMLVRGESVMGLLSAALIFLGGHLLNLLINILGSFVHGIRLQYVEFFSKFYEGGGTMFEPFQIKQILTKTD